MYQKKEYLPTQPVSSTNFEEPKQPRMTLAELREQRREQDDKTGASSGQTPTGIEQDN